MSAIKANLQVSPQDVYTTSSTQGTDLGAYATTGDGRIFRYARAGATALVPGTLVQSSAEDTTNLENLVPVAAAAGVKQITISTSTTVPANYLTGGFLATTTGAGYGYTYKIAGNLASSSSSLVINLEDPISVALVAATSKVDCFPSPFYNVVVNPTTATSLPIGAAITTCAASNYCWIQTHGPVNLTASSALAVGLGVAPSRATAGNVIASTTVVSGLIPEQIGFAITGVAANESGLVYLDLD